MNKQDKIERIQKSIKFITQDVTTWCNGTYITEKVSKKRMVAVFALKTIEIDDSANATEIATKLATKLVEELS